MPVSTTQVISSAIIGVGASKGVRGVRWGVARQILFAWLSRSPPRSSAPPGIANASASSWIVLNALGGHTWFG